MKPLDPIAAETLEWIAKPVDDLESARVPDGPREAFSKDSRSEGSGSCLCGACAETDASLAPLAEAATFLTDHAWEVAVSRRAVCREP